MNSTISPTTKKSSKELLLNYLVKPLFRIDILLSRLHLFSSSYQARQFISNGYVKVNEKKVSGNLSLKKGDIISFNFSKIQSNLNFLNFFQRLLNNNLFYSFIEIDYYTKTIVILKNVGDITVYDLNLLVTDFFDVYKLKS